MIPGHLISFHYYFFDFRYLNSSIDENNENDLEQDENMIIRL